jgi:hypothetical protein
MIHSVSVAVTSVRPSFTDDRRTMQLCSRTTLSSTPAAGGCAVRPVTIPFVAAILPVGRPCPRLSTSRERYNLQLLFQGFNLTNRASYGNNIVNSTGSGSFPARVHQPAPVRGVAAAPSSASSCASLSNCRASVPRRRPMSGASCLAPYMFGSWRVKVRPA